FFSSRRRHTRSDRDWIQTCALPISGRVILGAAKLVTPKAGKEFDRLMSWADAKRRMRVRANADIPADARRAREFGAEGIGLCRKIGRASCRERVESSMARGAGT